MNIKKWAAVIGTAALVGAGAVIGIAGPASAHTGDLFASATCNTATGNYEVTYTLTTAKTGEVGSTMWMVGDASFTGTPTSNAGLTRGPVASTGAETVTLGMVSVPGNSKSAPWAYAYTIWQPDNYQIGSDGGNIDLAGTCVDPIANDAVPGTVVVTPHCNAVATVTFDNSAAKFATSSSKLSTAPGSYTVKYVAASGHAFQPKGNTSALVHYTVPAVLPNQSTNSGAKCYVSPTPRVCTTATVLPTSTNLNSQGWTFGQSGQSNAGVYVTGGVQLTAPAGNVYRGTSSSITPFPLADAADAAIDLSANSNHGYIDFVLSNGDDVTYEPFYSNAWWTDAAGYFPAVSGSGGKYSAPDLSNLGSNTQVVAVYAVISAQGTDLAAVMHSVTFDCSVQPFDSAQKPIVPPKDPPSNTTPPVVQDTTTVPPAQHFEANTGLERASTISPVIEWGALGLMVLLALGLGGAAFKASKEEK